MADKMNCPGCDATTSSVRTAFEEGQRCPHCGLSAAAALEIEVVRTSRADEALQERYRLLTIEHDKLRARYRALAGRMFAVLDAVESVEKSDLLP